MQLYGSCHCGAARFEVDSPAPYPYMACYCSVCRKTAGGGGYAINLGADAESLRVEGEESLSVYQARILGDDGENLEVSPARRHFCRHCASALWLYDPRWPDLVHPFASAIDTPLPRPPETLRIMLASAAPWCEVPDRDGERRFPGFPDESLEDWHRRHDLYDDP